MRNRRRSYGCAGMPVALPGSTMMCVALAKSAMSPRASTVGNPAGMFLLRFCATARASTADGSVPGSRWRAR